VCGLGLARRVLPRPLLFQAGALQAKPVQEPRRAVVSAPALGRVDPVFLDESEPEALPIEPSRVVAVLTEPSAAQLGSEPLPEPPAESFWPLVRLEITEAGVLLALNLVVALGASWLAGVSLGRFYGELWHFLVPVHFAISWAFEMVPITLVGQSPSMGSLGLLLDSVQPERRIAFSLFHLISVALFPVSFFCMVLTPYHRTLAELLTGQEILARPLPRMK
jgi:hypothetical protein